MGCRHDDAAGHRPVAPVVAKKLGALPLQLDLPATTTLIVFDLGPTDLGHSFSVNISDSTEGLSTLELFGTRSRMPYPNGSSDTRDLIATLDGFKAFLATGPYKVKAFTREDKTSDGWILELTYETASRGEDVGVWVRRTIAGALWDCGEFHSSSHEEAANIKKRCLALRAQDAK